MADSIMYHEDYFVVLQPDKPEEFLTPEELLETLKGVLREHQGDLPRELQKIATLEEKAQCLRDNFCEWEREPGQYLQWYVVRLEK